MNWIKEHEIDSWLLRGAVALMLLFPAFYSPYTDVYQSCVLRRVLLGLFSGGIVYGSAGLE